MKCLFSIVGIFFTVAVLGSRAFALDCRMNWQGLGAATETAPPHPVDHFLAAHRKLTAAGQASSGQKLDYEGVDGHDVYNPTAPFTTQLGGKSVEVMAARVEPRNSEESQVMFFEKSGEKWHPLKGAPVFKLQDPCVAKVGDDLVVAGVQTFPKPTGGLGYRTVFYRGKSLSQLKQFAVGPEGMKDIRVLALPGGKVMVLTRPQGKVGGRGKIAMIVIDSLGALSPETIERATVYQDLFAADEWGGANELHLLKNGKVGVLGHIAKFDAAGNRHYYPMAFVIDPATGHRSPMKILLERSELPPGASKRTDLQDVLFSGGLVRNADGTGALYVGAGDAEVYRVTVKDPFAEFEK